MADRVTLFSDNEVVTTEVFNQRVDEINGALDGLDGTGGQIPQVEAELAAHIGNRQNPHNVTAAQAGADAAGSAAAVQSALNAHTGNRQNPHNVTAAQVGADASGAAADVQASLNSHTGDTAAHMTQAQKDTLHAHANKGALDGITAAKVAEWDGKAEVSAVQTAQNAANAAQSTANAALPKAGGTMTGQLTAQSNTAYTTRQARNILMFTSGTSLTGSQSGDVVHEYK